MIVLREFTDSGTNAFKQYLTQAREQPELPVPWDLLEDNAHTRPIEPRTIVEGRSFANRGEAAAYLRDLLSDLPEQSAAVNAGLWNWLTLFFFNEICPARAGKRAVKNHYYYLFEPKNARHSYRHLLYISWRIICLAPDKNRLFMSGSVASLDKVTSEVMKRLFLTRIPCIFEVLDRLYWDDTRKRPRPGITDFRNVKPGDLVHRFPIRMRQLERTYDLLTLKADQLVELLGEEFAVAVK
jgi:hypothetical protein